MRILLLWGLYDQYTEDFYARHPDLDAAPYAEQHRALLGDFFGWPGYLSRGFQAIGHESDILFGNVKPLQKAWAQEHNVLFQQESYQIDLPEQQIRSYRPDVLFLGAMSQYWGSFLQRVRPACGKVFIWIASSLRAIPSPQSVDCVLTAFPHFVKHFRQAGIPAEYYQAACFDSSIPTLLPDLHRDIGIGFVGNFFVGAHRKRVEMLDFLLKQGLELHIWGSATSGHFPRHPLRLVQHLQWQDRLKGLKSSFHPETAYGLNMYRLLHRFRLSPNIHEDVAGHTASNMRLFEITGSGALLVSDNLPQLGRFFQVGQEVVAYDCLDDLADKLRYYLQHEDEARQIASSGKTRTLREHTGEVRARELISFFEQYPSAK